MHSEIESKSFIDCTPRERDIQIAGQLAIAVNGESLQSISSAIGYNPETIRRYLKGETKIPADFVRQIAIHCNHDANLLLCLRPTVATTIQLRSIATDQLINELGRRMKMIENCAIASVVVNPDQI